MSTMCNSESFFGQLCSLNASLGDLITAAVTAIAAGIALYSLWRAQRHAQTRNTMDFISQLQSHPQLREAKIAFENLARRGVLTAYAENMPSHLDAIDKIDLVLNQYEQVAYGYLAGVFDCEYIEMWFKSQMLWSVTQAEGYIRHFRDPKNKFGDHETFSNLMCLYVLWGGKVFSIEEREMLCRQFPRKLVPRTDLLA